jgi:hypothetical protein
MRKSLIAAVAVIVAALALPSIGQADPVQSITANLTPAKRSKKKFKPAKIYVEILTKDNTGDPVNPEQPPSAYRTKVNFPKNMKFNTRKAPRCKASTARLQNTTTRQAIRRCGKRSVVSVGGGKLPTSAGHSNGTSAWVTIDTPGPGTTLEVPVKVVAMNGSKKNQLYLHSRAESLGVTTVLVGRLKMGKKAPKGYGSQLDVRIPPLALGAIRRFTTTVKSGKYVRARCRQRTNKFQAISFYDNHPRTADVYKTRCKPKKHRRKHRTG